jgi:hypothetical protein
MVARRITALSFLSLSMFFSISLAFADNFIWELLCRSAAEAPGLVQRSWLSNSFDFLVFASAFLLHFFSFRKKQRLKRIKKALQASAAGAISLIIWWTVLFSYSVWLQSKKIETDAMRVSIPRPELPRVPLQWASFRSTKPGASKVILIFKESPAFTAERKSHIQKTIDEVYVYLKNLGFDVPAECPPIGVDSSGIFRSSGIYPGSVYDRNFMLPEQRLDDEELIRWAYSQQVFRVLFYQNPDWSEGMGQFAAETFARYYASTISGAKFGIKDSLLNKLWSVRQKEGKPLTDRAMFYTYKVWYETRANTEEKADFDAFFLSRFSMGANVVANGFEQYREILSILK